MLWNQISFFKVEKFAFFSLACWLHVDIYLPSSTTFSHLHFSLLMWSIISAWIFLCLRTKQRLHSIESRRLHRCTFWTRHDLGSNSSLSRGMAVQLRDMFCREMKRNIIFHQGKWRNPFPWNFLPRVKYHRCFIIMKYGLKCWTPFYNFDFLWCPLLLPMGFAESNKAYKIWRKIPNLPDSTLV